MKIATSKLLQDRNHAACLLAIKVGNLKDSDAIVVGIGHEGASIGAVLAKELNLAFEVVMCRQIKHPAHRDKTIGSVSDGMAVMNDDIHDIPQDYLVRQVAKLQFEIEKDYRSIYGCCPRPSFKYKTVIPVGDLLPSPNSLMAGLKVIKAQNPLKMIVAIPVVEPLAAAEIAREVNDLVFVHIGSHKVTEKDIYDVCPPVDLIEIKKSITSINVGLTV